MATQFSALTGASADVAAMYIEMAGGSVDVAISLFFDSGGAPPAAPAAPPASTVPHWWRVIAESPTLPACWIEQGIAFKGAAAGPWCGMGLTQIANGPCGVIAALQAAIVAQRLHTIEATYEPTPADVAAAISALITSSATSSGRTTCAVARFTGAGARAPVLASAIEFDVVAVDVAVDHVTAHLDAFTAAGGLVLIVASAVKTRGAEAVVSDMAGDSQALINGPNSFTSTALVSLLLRGIASSDVGAYSALLGGAKQSWLDKSDARFALPIGLLSSDEIQTGVPHADELKSPAQPVWILHGGDHFTTAWIAPQPESAAAVGEEGKACFVLTHWNGLAPGVCATALRIDARQHGAAAPAAADSSESGGVATFYKPLPGQIGDVVQAHAADKAARPDAWATHRYEVVLAVDDPDVSGAPRPEEMPLPRIYAQGEASEEAWRCASCYRGRFRTMCFGGNGAGAVACAHCSKARADAGWSIWLPYEELPAGWQRKLTARYAPAAVKLLQTKWPGASIDWDGFPTTRPHV